MKMHKDSVSRPSYETMAEYYFEYVDHKPFNAFYERPGTLSLLPDVRGRHVLDAACAAGWYTEWLLEHGAQVTAVDFSQCMVKMTKKRVGNRARIVQADLNYPLDFLADQSVDIVLSSLTLHYIRDWGPLFSEFHRILKDKGQFVFSIHHPFMDFSYFQSKDYFRTELLEDEWNTHRGPVKVQFYRRPLTSIFSFLTQAGFVVHRLLEPMPIEEFKAIDPERYDRLTKRPQFLFIGAVRD